MQQEDFLARLCKARGAEGPPTFHRLGPGNVRGLQAPMNEQGAVCQARGQKGLEAQPWGRPVKTWDGRWGWKITVSLVPSTFEPACQATR